MEGSSAFGPRDRSGGRLRPIETSDTVLARPSVKTSSKNREGVPPNENVEGVVELPHEGRGSTLPDIETSLPPIPHLTLVPDGGKKTAERISKIREKISEIPPTPAQAQNTLNSIDAHGANAWAGRSGTRTRYNLPPITEAQALAHAVDTEGEKHWTGENNSRTHYNLPPITEEQITLNFKEGHVKREMDEASNDSSTPRRDREDAEPGLHVLPPLTPVPQQKPRKTRNGMARKVATLISNLFKKAA